MKNKFKKAASFMIFLVFLMSFLPQITLSASAASSGTCGYNLTWSLNSSGTLTISGSGAMWERSHYSTKAFPWESSSTSIKSVVISEGVTNVADYVFTYCENLTSVSIANSVTSIGNGAFSYCPKLSSVTLGTGVKTIGYEAFCCCESLSTLVIPDSVTTIGNYAFENCIALNNLTIGNGVKTIGDSAFYGCTSLTSISIPNSVESIGNYAFSYSSSLASITLPDSGLTIGANAFSNTAYYNNSSNWENDILYIGKYLVNAKSGITSANIKEGTLYIASYAFSYCTNLTAVTLPEGFVSVGSDAFRGCSKLASVTIPASVENIGSNAFYRCSSLTTVNYGGTKEEWNDLQSNSSDNSLLFNANVYVTGYDEETEALVADANAVLEALKDGSSEVSAVVENAKVRVSAFASDVSLTTSQLASKIENLLNETKMCCGMLNLRFQITGGTTTSSAESDMRFISTVDNLTDYKEVGFYITLNGIQKRIALKTVYSTIIGKENSTTVYYTPSEIFPDSNYFSTYSIWGIPNSAFNTPITVQAFVVLTDGTEICGVTKIRTVSDFIN